MVRLKANVRNWAEAVVRRSLKGWQQCPKIGHSTLKFEAAAFHPKSAIKR
jgi:hypothetical protein